METQRDLLKVGSSNIKLSKYNVTIPLRDEGEKFAVFLVSIPIEKSSDGAISKLHNYLSQNYGGDLDYVKDLVNNDSESDVDLSVEIIDGEIHFIEI